MSHIFKVNIKLKYPIMVTFKYQMTFMVSRIIMLIKSIQMFYSLERGGLEMADQRKMHIPYSNVFQSKGSK